MSDTDPDVEFDSLSSNHKSVDDQLQDAVSYLEHNQPEQYAAFLIAFPEWPNRTFGDGHSSWFDTEKMGVDPEWGSWAVDWIEGNTDILWEDGEPWIRKES